MRAERTLRNPGISPGPAVSSPNTVQLLIPQNRVNQRPTLLPLSRNRIRPTLQLPRTRRLHRNPRRLQGTQKILRRIRVQRRHKQHALNLLRQLLHLLRTLPRHRTRTQQLAQMLMMRLHIKRDAVIANLSRHQRTGRLGRRQKTQSLRVPRLANSACLRQPLTHQHTHHRMLRQQSHRARRQLRGKRLMRRRLQEIRGGISRGQGGVSSGRTQKISAEQLLLTLNLPRHRQIPLRLHRLTHIRKVQHRAVLHKTIRMRSRSHQNSLHQTQIMAQMHPHPAAQKQRVNMAGISPNPARKTCLRRTCRLPLHLTHIRRKIRRTHPIRARNPRNKGWILQLLSGRRRKMKSTPRGHRLSTARRRTRSNSRRDRVRGGAGLGGNTRAGGRTEQNVHSSIIGDRAGVWTIFGHGRVFADEDGLGVRAKSTAGARG